VEDCGGLGAEEGAVFGGSRGGVGDVEVVLDVFCPDALCGGHGEEGIRENCGV